ncbi:MAG: precorrin-6A reductase [Clostridiales bacterium]|nr:precorrin-6A reductase [Clostridiales bacterium]MCF8022264.1 precorrin-6A reductase [Clostridiales bacterium]
MIWVLGGTSDGRKLVRELVKRDQRVGVVVFSSYGKELVHDDGAYEVEQVSTDMLVDWLYSKKIKILVDGRHPSSVYNEKEDKLLQACSTLSIVFYRIGREETVLDNYHNVYKVFSMEQAAQKVVLLGKTIFLTTGSNQLETFLSYKEKYNLRLVVRVLPEHKVIKKCQDMGIRPKDIVAMQGPFSKQVNRALFKMYRVSVVVTKDSGKAGGTDAKLAVAKDLGIPVVMVVYQCNGKSMKWQEILNLLTCYLQ